MRGGTTALSLWCGREQSHSRCRRGIGFREAAGRERQTPKWIEVWDGLPRSKVGKVLKSENARSGEREDMTTAVPAQRRSELFSHSATSAVAQLKSKCALQAFIATTVPRTQMICTSVLVEKTLLNSVI